VLLSPQHLIAIARAETNHLKPVKSFHWRQHVRSKVE
jgi:hypothetical protein